DLASAMSLGKINIYGVSYGTRRGLEVMRRPPGLVRAAVLDGVYPPEVNGEQNEPEIVRQAFEQLYAECTADPLCRERHPGLRRPAEATTGAPSRLAQRRRGHDRGRRAEAGRAHPPARGWSAAGPARRTQVPHGAVAYD